MGNPTPEMVVTMNQTHEHGQPADRAIGASEQDWLTLAEFRAAVSRSFVPLQVTSTLGDEFRGSIRQASVGDVTFTVVVSDPHLVQRTPELIERSPRQFYKISLQLEGRSYLSQGGREIYLEPSDLAIYDTNKPYTLRFDAPFRVVVIQLPHERFDVPAHVAAHLTAVRLAGADGLGRVVSPFLTTLAADLGQLEGPAGHRLVANGIDLLKLLFAHQADAAKAATDPNWALLQRIRDHIDANLDDGELSPTSIAEATFISTRHLHNLFQKNNMTVSTYVRTRRLEKCYLDLTDPLRADEPVSSVGSRWGFTDAAHFSRVFKATYGETPSAARTRTADPARS